jgi:hypothetical protein
MFYRQTNDCDKEPFECFTCRLGNMGAPTSMRAEDLDGRCNSLVAAREHKGFAAQGR